MTAPIKVTITDPKTGEVLGERILHNDYMVVCAGDRFVADTVIFPNETHQLTIKRDD